jgi:hypothetical protein
MDYSTQEIGARTRALVAGLWRAGDRVRIARTRSTDEPSSAAATDRRLSRSSALRRLCRVSE